MELDKTKILLQVLLQELVENWQRGIAELWQQFTCSKSIR